MGDWREILVEAESLVALVAILAGGFLPPLLLTPLIVEGAMRKDTAEIAVFAGLVVAAAAGAIWVGRMARAAMANPAPALPQCLESREDSCLRATLPWWLSHPWLSR